MAASQASSSPSPSRVSKPLLLLLLLTFAAFFSGADARGHHLHPHHHRTVQAPAPAPSWPPEWTQYKEFPDLASFSFASPSGIIHDGNECFDCCIPACLTHFSKEYTDECPFFCVRTCSFLFDN